MSSRYLKLIESNSNLYKSRISGNVKYIRGVSPSSARKAREVAIKSLSAGLFGSPIDKIQFTNITNSFCTYKTLDTTTQVSKFQVSYGISFFLSCWMVNNIGWH